MSLMLAQDADEDLRRQVFVGALCDRPAVLRAGGEKVTREKRAELIEQSLAGKHIELELELVAFSQTPGVMNRNFVRFKPGRLAAMARSGKGTPFLRDHAQRDQASAGGIILSSKLEREGEKLDIVQVARLTVPWAVQGALQGVLGKYSIGWYPLGSKPGQEPQTFCSLCKGPIGDCIWKLGHYRGSEHDGQIVEFIVQNAELIETSGVNVPAVREVELREIRGLDRLFVTGAELDPAPTKSERERSEMSKNAREKLMQALGLVEGSDDERVLAAVEAVRAERDQAAARATKLETELGLARSQLEDATGELETLRARHKELADKSRAERAEAFLARAIEAGKCTPNGATAGYFRDLYAADEKAAEETLARAPVVSPVGQPRQSAAAAPSATSAQSAEPDYARLAMQLSADDRKTADRSHVSYELYVRSNYDELAAEYGWPSRKTA